MYRCFASVTCAVFIALPLLAYGVWYGVANTPFAFKSTEWLGVMSHMWLVYFYVSLALRENILRVVSGCHWGGVGLLNLNVL